MIKSKTVFLTTIFPANKLYVIDFFDSLQQQTYKNFDIVVVNDGFDDFEGIIKKYSQELNIIELKYSDTAAKNREYGINYCIEKSYDILIFGDSDDYFAKNRIEKSIELLKNNDIIVNDLSLFDENGIYDEGYLSHRIKNRQMIDFEFIKDKNIFGMTNTAIRLSMVSNVSFDSEIIAIDWYFFTMLLKNRYKAIFTNETVSFYRQHKNNMIGLKSENNIYYLWWEKR